MSVNTKPKSFWSTTSGVVTGVAGTLTGVVGLITVASQMGWIGSDSDSSRTDNVQTEGSTAPGSPTTAASGRGGSSGTGTPSATPTFTVDPARLSFEGLTRKLTVKVLNTGRAALDVQAPEVEGTNPTQFNATAPSCTRGPVQPDRTCDIEVNFTPSRAGTYSATLVVEATGARPQEVQLSGVSIL
jgi:hypothetical protein